MLKGKGIWFNVIKECDGGDIQKIANKCEQAGISYALIKAIEGKSGYNFSGDIDLVKVLTKALREKGIDVVAWGAVYGDSFGAGYWKDEVNRVVRRMNDELTDINWFILDIESRWRDQRDIANMFMVELYAGLRIDCKVGFSSFRYPDQSGTIPYDVFLPAAHVNIPQVYWEGAHDPVDQLRECIRQYLVMGYGPDNIPMVPAAPAYHKRKINWETTPRSLRQFFAEVLAQGFESCTFWDYKNARAEGLWPVIGELEFPVDPEPPDPPPPGDHCDQQHEEIYRRLDELQEELISNLIPDIDLMKVELETDGNNILELQKENTLLTARVSILETKLSVWHWLCRMLRIAPEEEE